MSFALNESIIVQQKQLHGNISLITAGEFIEQQGNLAVVRG